MSLIRSDIFGLSPCFGHSNWGWPWGVMPFYQRRRNEDEDEFAKFMMGVDPRFDGILAHLVHPEQQTVKEPQQDQAAGEQSKGKEVVKQGESQQDQAAGEQSKGKEVVKQGESSKAKNYHMEIAVHNFKPEDIKVKVQGNNLLIEAKREVKKEGQGMYAHSYCEFKRSFSLPEGVDKKQLQSHLTSGGILEIDAPIVAAIQAAPEKQKIDVEHMEQDKEE